MSEFQIDIDKALENAKKNDLSTDWSPHYPDGLESVRKSVDNCVNLAGLDKKVMEKLLAGEWSHYTTFNSTGRTSKKIVIEYDVNVKKET
tara:strand:+ start:157 stop:426 length:270 start_codon:yes stop_codon:yes gene_type:complete